MKGKYMLVAMLSVCILFSVAADTVIAADVGYVCTMNRIGAGRDGVAIFNVTCPALSASPHWFKAEPASYKSYLAIALTALSMESEVFIVIDSALGDWQPIKQFYVLP